jgi:carbamoyl-phosphate synthase large subunit
LDEIKNDITQVTPASFEPTLDYIVVKAPRFAFEKFQDADPRLTTTMKSVGEAMAIGRSFPEALMKALRSLERKEAIFAFTPARSGDEISQLLESMKMPTEYRLQQVQRALWLGATMDQVFDATKIDRWFLRQIEIINEVARDTAQPGELSLENLKTREDTWISPILKSRLYAEYQRLTLGRRVINSNYVRCIKLSTPAPRNLKHSLPITTQVTRMRLRSELVPNRP